METDVNTQSMNYISNNNNYCSPDRYGQKAGLRKFSPLRNVQIGSGAYPSPIMHTAGYLDRVKRSERETDHSPASSAEVMNDETVPPLPHTSSWNGA
jgi:hypothetical protein